MSNIQWDSQLYLRYERERTQPSIDLASRIDLQSAAEIIDLGCGPGNSTRVLRERWPAAQAVYDVSESPAWKSHRLSERYTLRTHTPGEYYDWLAPLSRQLQLWETVYFHELANHEAIVEFYSSTGLKPYLDGLPSVELKDQFTTSVFEAYCKMFPTQRNGKVLFPFRRIFLIAAR